MSGADVYAVGEVATGNYYEACYWKNGIKQPLEVTGNYYSYAESIALQGEDIYVVGWVEFRNGTVMACCWKNGVRYDLPSSGIDVSAYDIVIDGTDIFILGDTLVGRKVQPCLWKNGVLTDMGWSGLDAQINKFYLY